MELRLALCGVVFVALMVTGSNAQLDVCGDPKLNPKIVGGGNAAAGTWPWHALLVYNSLMRCSGSLINDQFVLTAAQCVDGLAVSNLTVWLGALNVDTYSPFTRIQSVSTIIKHPSYNPDKQGYNIALLKLSSPVIFNNYIRPVCLAQSGSKYESGSCWVTGLGNINTNTSLPKPRILQEVEVPIVAISECKNIYASVPDNTICAGSAGTGICYGDGGSPLASKNTKENKWVQGGLASFFSTGGCAVAGVPDGYTEVSRYESWIKSQIPTNQPGFILRESPTAEPPTTGTPTTVTPTTVTPTAGTPTTVTPTTVTPTAGTSAVSLPLLLLSSSLLLSSIFSEAV